jgi:hypothetical protein
MYNVSTYLLKQQSKLARNSEQNGLITANARRIVIFRETDKIKQIKSNYWIDYSYFLFLIPTLNKNYLIWYDFVCFTGDYILTGFGRDQAVKHRVTGA